MHGQVHRYGLSRLSTPRLLFLGEAVCSGTPPQHTEDIRVTNADPPRATEEPPRSTNPWRSRAFRLLMVGSTTSQFGFQITTVAVPLVAVLTLQATATQVGLIRTVGQLPYPLFVLFIGVAVDRWRRRNMLLAGDLLRAVALLVVPIAFFMHFLDVPTLLVVELLVGIGTVLFDVGSTAYLPRLVDRDQIARGNSQLQSAESIATISGPALGGLLVSLLQAPRALIASVVLWIASVVAIWQIRTPEPAPDPAARAVKPVSQIAEGIRFVARNPILRPSAIITAAYNFCYAAFLVIFIVYLPNELGLSGFEIGLVLAAIGPGFLAGAMLSSSLPRRFGYGRVLLPAAFLSTFFLLGMSLVRGPEALLVVLLIVFNLLYGCLSGIFAISLVALRQAATPDRLLGRVMATLRFLGVGPVPIGSAFGGFFAAAVGLQQGLIVLAVVMCLVPIPFFVLRTSLTRIGRELPASAEA
jgi:MFS family permease